MATKRLEIVLEPADAEQASGPREVSAAEVPPPGGQETTATRRPEEVVIGKMMGLGDHGQPMVDFPGNSTRRPLAARSTTPLGERHVGREVALLFEAGELEKPIVMGLLHLSRPEPAPPPTAELDGERLELSAEREIVLRCGHASITLTRAGKILLRGKFLLSRSSGVNRIKGGSVQIN